MIILADNTDSFFYTSHFGYTVSINLRKCVHVLKIIMFSNLTKTKKLVLLFAIVFVLREGFKKMKSMFGRKLEGGEVTKG